MFKRDKICVLGVDPGLEGALAVLDIDGAISILDLPTTGIGTKRCLDEHGISRWLGNYSIDHAYIEYVSAMPGWGSGGSFRFGMSFGILRAIVSLRGIPYTLVTPAKWKKHFALPGKDKEASRQRALQLNPHIADLLSRKKDHQRAEALLLATYGMECSSSGNQIKRPHLISSASANGD